METPRTTRTSRVARLSCGWWNLDANSGSGPDVLLERGDIVPEADGGSQLASRGHSGGTLLLPSMQPVQDLRGRVALASKRGKGRESWETKLCRWWLWVQSPCPCLPSPFSSPRRIRVPAPSSSRRYPRFWTLRAWVNSCATSRNTTAAKTCQNIKSATGLGREGG